MSRNTKITEIAPLFSSLTLKNLEGVNIGELLAAPIFGFSNNSSLSYKGLLKTALSYVLRCGYQMNSDQEQKYLFCFTNSYGTRKDYISVFEKVKSLTVGNVEINPHYRIRLNFRRIVSVILLFVWMRQTKATKLPYKTRWYFCNQILLTYIDSNEIFNMLSDILPHIRLGVTFCDIHSVDYLLTYRFKRMGIPTATVEHGHFIAGWYFGNSHSDYFLAHGEFAREQAVKSGLKPDNVIAVGMMQHIHENIELHKKSVCNSGFGVFLNSPDFEKKDNVEILTHANRLAKEFNLKYAVRYHPALKRAAYIPLIDKSCLSDIDGNAGSVADFARKIEFAILGTSTTFMELLRLAVPVFRFPNEEDFYPTITEFNFKCYEELVVLYNRLKDEKQCFSETIIQASELLCPTGDAAPRYKAFFDRFA